VRSFIAIVVLNYCELLILDPSVADAEQVLRGTGALYELHLPFLWLS
jgi:hypothetical protein